MIKKYVKKPVVIEAIKFEDNPGTIAKILNFSGDVSLIDYPAVGGPKLFIETLEGVMAASVGDYVIKGVRGEIYPCKPDIFKETYEEVKE